MADGTDVAAGASGAAAGATSSASGGTQAGNTPWYGADNDLKAWAETKGWHDKPADEVAREAAKSRREAEKKLGVSPDQLLRKPKDASDAENWGKINEFLGVPASADKYNFDTVKHPDGSSIDDATVGSFREFAHNNRLTPDQASSMARFLVEQQEKSESLDNQTAAQHVQAAQAQLRADWGANYGYNEVIAGNALKAYFQSKGVTGEVAQQKINSMLEIADKSTGIDTFMDFLRWTGLATGQDQFITNGQGTNGRNDPLSPQGAKAKIDQLMQDKQWVARYMKKDYAAVQEFDNLTNLAAKAYSVPAYNTGRR